MLARRASAAVRVDLTARPAVGYNRCMLRRLSVQTVDSPAVRVELSSGWLPYVLTAVAVLALGLALLAVWYASRQAQLTREQAAQAALEAREEAALERRLQYELGVLAEMSRQHDITGLQHLGGYTRALVRADAPDDELPLLRRLMDVHPTELGAAKDREIEEQIEGEGLAARGTRDSRRARVVGREIEDAIDRRTS